MKIEYENNIKILDAIERGSGSSNYPLFAKIDTDALVADLAFNGSGVLRDITQLELQRIIDFLIAVKYRLKKPEVK